MNKTPKKSNSQNELLNLTQLTFLQSFICYKLIIERQVSLPTKKPIVTDMVPKKVADMVELRKAWIAKIRPPPSANKFFTLPNKVTAASQPTHMFLASKLKPMLVLKGLFQTWIP